MSMSGSGRGMHSRWALLASSICVFGSSQGLTCMGLHVLQKIAVELKLDPTGATRVGFWRDRWHVTSAPYPGTMALGCRQV